jgi:hypothetical protein
MTNIEKQSEIDNLYDLLDAYSKVRHLVDFGELISKTHEAISLLEDDDDVERNEYGDELVSGCATCGEDVTKTDINGNCSKCK